MQYCREYKRIALLGLCLILLVNSGCEILNQEYFFPTQYEKETSTLPLNEQAPIQTIPPTPDPQDELVPILEETIKDMDGEWSIYIEDLKRDKVTVIDNRQMVAASVIKIFTAGAYFNEINEGNIVESEYSDEQLRLMISLSDNDAWEALERYLANGDPIRGFQKVTEFAEANGYKDTGRLIGAESSFSADAKNLSSVTDIGNALHEIYHNTYVDEHASQKILQYMLAQERTQKIPAGLPEGTKCANKTGELEDVHNDAAIIYADNTDYILVIMTEKQISDYVAFENIAEVSRIVYEYMSQIEE